MNRLIKIASIAVLTLPLVSVGSVPPVLGQSLIETRATRIVGVAQAYSGNGFRKWLLISFLFLF